MESTFRQQAFVGLKAVIEVSILVLMESTFRPGIPILCMVFGYVSILVLMESTFRPFATIPSDDVFSVFQSLF